MIKGKSFDLLSGVLVSGLMGAITAITTTYWRDVMANSVVICFIFFAAYELGRRRAHNKKSTDEVDS